MLTRRELLNYTLAGSAALVGGAAAAQALTFQKMPPDVAAAYALGCGNVGGHDRMMADARLALQGEIARGAMPAGAQQIVVCPICGCRMVVSAESSF
jgi:hypothetical protein